MTPPRPQQMIARFEDKIVHNEKFVQMSFELAEPHRMEFMSGQYVSIKVDEQGHRRSYSICSTPDIDHGFELLIDLAPQGMGVKYLENLQFGNEIQLLAPMGVFVMEEDPEEQAIVFVATGSGIAPLRSMILNQLINKQDKRPMILYWGVRHESDWFWLLEFEELTEKFPNFSFHPVLSQPQSEEWTLCKGRVTDCLLNHPHPENAGYYICGNERMLSDVVALLQKKGINEKHIHHEKFY